MYLEWVQMAEQTSLIMDAVYLFGIFIGLTIRAILMSFINNMEFGLEDLQSITVLSVLIWIVLFRLFLVSIVAGVGYFVWVAIIKQMKEHIKSGLGLSIFWILFGAIGLMNLI